MRKDTKKRFARRLHGVRSRRRRREIVASYYGIAKWGRCGNLMRTILRQNGIMSFAELGIRTETVRRGKDGKKVFDVPEVKVAELARGGREIAIDDFETGCDVREKKNRSWILFHYVGDAEDSRYKTVTSSPYITDKLRRLGEMRDAGKDVLPLTTRLTERRTGRGYTYDVE